VTQEDRKRIVIGSDHAGFALKEHLKKHLESRGLAVEDLGVHAGETSDYPLDGARVARAISKGEFERGIVVCGTGIGISIAANRFRRVRAALCMTPEMARTAREHNNANVLALGGRILEPEQADEILDAWLDTDFGGGRHERRVNQLGSLCD
jgi:ribose 5-phosphate isomerase B